MLRSSIPKTSISKRALSLRRAHRLASQRASSSRRTASIAANYAPRVLAGDFEPTAVRARHVAQSRNQTLHELAHELGYASTPPRVRKPVDLDSLRPADVARASGYDISDVCRVFARKHPPTLTKLARIAAAYDAWMDDVLTAIGW